MTEEEKTDLEKWEEKIAAEEAEKATYPDQWTWQQEHHLQSMYLVRDNCFDEEGNYVPMQNPPVYEPENEISPPEVLELQGYRDEQGLSVSNQRRMGHVVLQQQVEQGEAMIRDPKAFVEKYGGSERVYYMMGHRLTAMPWTIIPANDPGSRASAYEPFTPAQPEVPYNEAEVQLWNQNFNAFHMHPMTGGSNIKRADSQKPAEEGTDPYMPDYNRARMYGFSIWTAPNMPQEIIPQLREKYHTTKFLKDLYKPTVNTLHQIDNGAQAYEPGYKTPQEMGGSHSQGWYERVGETERVGREDNPAWPEF